ncbi:hypothetical protein HK098_006386 [Nowakowskiella sp. JEL0407]|nr:hypothetical protein HK098_006386 [Nowakowskiella sp. JEL0407]
MNSVIQSDGVAGLWRGTIPTIFRNVPGSAVYFWSLNEIRQALMIVRWVPSGNEKAGLTSYHGNSDLKFKGLSPDSINLIAGASARTFAGFVLMPISVIKTRFESNHYQYSSIFAASSAIWKKEGVYGLFRGFSATALRDSPYAGLYLLFYERSRAFFGPWAHPQSPYHALTTAISGGVSGVLASVLTNPFDVVKTRMQVNPEKYPGFWKTVGKVLKDEGFAGFAGGLGPRLARKVIAAAITWTIYEEVMLLFAPKNQS